MLKRRLSTGIGREKRDALLLKQLGRLAYMNTELSVPTIVINSKRYAETTQIPAIALEVGTSLKGKRVNDE